MREHRRITDNIKEPQTLDEFVRAIYIRQTDALADIKSLTETVKGNGKPGLCDRMIRVETTLKLAGALLIVIAGWISFK